MTLSRKHTELSCQWSDENNSYIEEDVQIKSIVDKYGQIICHEMSSSSQPLSNSLPWKTRLFCRLVECAYYIILRSDFTINRCLLRFVDRRSLPYSRPRKGVTSFDTILDLSRDLWVRTYTPVALSDVASNAMAVIVYYHGGGFALFSASSNFVDATARLYAREFNAVVVSVNYRLAPEHRFPCQYEDGFDALKFIDEMEDDAFPAGADRSRCFLAGESAGGNLAHHVAVKASECVFKKVKLIGLIAVQPFFGGEERTESELRLPRAPLLPLSLSDWFWKAFLPVGSDRDHSASNLVGPNGVDISGMVFPATLVITGGLDPLQDWNRRYCLMLIKSGKEAEVVEFPNAFHGFTAFPELPEFPLFLQAVRDFMKKHTTK